MKKVVIFLIFVALGVSNLSYSHASAGVYVGESCQEKNSVIYQNGEKWICQPAPRSLSNPLGKKASWQRKITDFSKAKSEKDQLGILNSLGYGYWSKSTEQGFQGKQYVSNYPCLLYVGSSEEDLLRYWNYKVNGMFYTGGWVAIQSKKWIVNDVSSDSSCIKYFAYKYGGRISYQ